MKQPVSVAELVARLDRLQPGEVTLDTVGTILAAPLDEASLAPFTGFRRDRYARHLVQRSALFDVMVLCWQPGQLTPVHNHSGQLGWVRLVRGRIEETSYVHEGGGPVPELAGLEIDEQGRGLGVSLLETGRAVVSAAGTVATVDRQRAIHRLGNPAVHRDDEPALTLHVYSRPHDSCLVFDPGSRTCWRRQLRFDSVPAGAGPGLPLVQD